MVVGSYDGSGANVDSLTFNASMLLFYALVTVKISAGRNWARRAYAFLIALELALVSAFGLAVHTVFCCSDVGFTEFEAGAVSERFLQLQQLHKS